MIGKKYLKITTFRGAPNNFNLKEKMECIYPQGQDPFNTFQQDIKRKPKEYKIIEGQITIKSADRNQKNNLSVVHSD